MHTGIYILMLCHNENQFMGCRCSLSDTFTSNKIKNVISRNHFLLLQNTQQSNFVQLKSILNSNLNPKSETIEALYFNIKLLNFQERPARRIL